MAQGSEIQTGLPQLPEGVPQELFSHFLSIYNAIHNLGRQLSKYAGVDEQPGDIWSQLSMDDTLLIGNLNRLYVRQNESLSFGQLISPLNIAGEIQVRKANATDNTKWACGIVSSNDHIPSAGEFCEIRVGSWLCDGISGLITAQRYWLSTTDGIVSNVPAVAAGNIEQYVGFALAGNRFLMHIDGNWIQH